jgi:hypothetical protein
MAKFEVVQSEVDLPARRLGQEDGTAFGWFDRWQIGTTPDGKYITDYADWEARDLFEMLAKDYKAKQIENVLSLPVMSAEPTIVPAKGDNGEAEWLNGFWEADPFQGGPMTSLDQIIGLCTSAFYYKRAYFEKVWVKGRGQFEGKIVYGDVAFRPQTTCRLMRDPKNGRYKGFEQEAYYMGPEISQPSKWPIQIKAQNAFVFTHGTRKDPLNGVSDMEVAYWAYKTKQRILMLWFQFLAGVALPRTIIKAQDEGVAKQVAREVARLKNSGVLPVAAPSGPDSIAIDTLDVSGKGHEQFKEVIQWLDNAATSSILAGFLDLTTTANEGRGSYALSNDQSDFFLQSLEAKTRELERQIRQDLFAPLIFLNFGTDAAVPYLQFEPLNDIDKQNAITLLQTAMTAPPGGPVPSSFIAGLAEQVSNYLGLDGAQMRSDFKESFDAAAAQAKAQAMASTAPGAGSPVGQQVAALGGAVAAAHKAVQAGAADKGTLKQLQKAHATDQKLSAQQAAKDGEIHNMIRKTTEDSLRAKTGGEKSLLRLK